MMIIRVLITCRSAEIVTMAVKPLLLLFCHFCVCVCMCLLVCWCVCVCVCVGVS